MQNSLWRHLLIPGVVIIGAGALTWPLMAADRWSGLGQWAGAVGTVWAVVVALRAFTEESRRAQVERAERDKAQAQEANRLEAERRDREAARAQEDHRLDAERRDHEMTQARLVTVHVTWPDPDDPEDIPPGIKIENHSSLPILEPKIEGFALLDGIKVEWEYDTNIFDFWGPPEVLRATETVTAPISFTMPGDFPSNRAVPVVSFTDVAGRRWRRSGAQAPERLLSSLTMPTDSDTSSAGEQES